MADGYSMVMLAEISTRYDPAGRLDTVSLDGVVIADYGYDSNSNRIAVTQVGAGVPGSGCAAGLANVSATVDAQDRLLTYGQCSYSYGANGELATKTDAASAQTTDYQYDSFGNLRQVILPDARAITYQIDGQHRRIGKSIDGVPVQGLVYMNALEPVAETDGDGNLVSLFVYAERPNTPSYLLKAGQLYRIISDQLGSVRLVVNTADGSIAQRIDYDAWGNTLEDTHPGFQPFGFAGGIVDRDTGLVRFGARDYDPETGRWTSKDPIGFGGDDANLYEYVLSDPVNAMDVNGLMETLGRPPSFFAFTTFESARRGVSLDEAVSRGSLFRGVTAPAIIGAGSINAIALGGSVAPVLADGIIVGANSCRAAAQSEAAQKAALATCLALSICQGTPARQFVADRERTAQIVTGIASEARRIFRTIFPGFF